MNKERGLDSMARRSTAKRLGNMVMVMVYRVGSDGKDRIPRVFRRFKINIAMNTAERF